MPKKKNSKKKFKKIITIIIPVVIGVILTFYIQQYVSYHNTKNKIFEISEYNFGIACLTTRFLTQFESNIMPSYQYETNIYKNNLDFIRNHNSREQRSTLLEAMSLMDISGAMMEAAVLGSRTDAEEIRKNLERLSLRIMENIKQYDARIGKIECDY